MKEGKLIMQSRNSKHIVQLEDYWEEGTTTFCLVMEFCQSDLRKFLAQQNFKKKELRNLLPNYIL